MSNEIMANNDNNDHEIMANIIMAKINDRIMSIIMLIK